MRRRSAAEVGEAVGIADIQGEATPEGKAEAVGGLRREGEVVVMVGDGLNDAPALAAADVGVALGATGSTISSDAAEAVILVDDLGRVAEAIEIGRDTLAVARTGIVVGMGLSARAHGRSPRSAASRRCTVRWHRRRSTSPRS